MDSALDILVYGIPAVLLVIGLTEVIKRIGLNSKYAPLVSIGWGIFLLILAPAIAFKEAIVKGIFLGLVASGLWSSFKATILGK